MFVFGSLLLVLVRLQVLVGEESEGGANDDDAIERDAGAGAGVDLWCARRARRLLCFGRRVAGLFAC